MTVAPWVWVVSAMALIAVLAIDLFAIGWRPRVPRTGELVAWVGIYVAGALAFAAGLWAVAGAAPASQFLAGWVTEYSLSVDNLFVFVLIMGRLAVPERFQQTALLFGIVLALVLRGLFIAAGAALVSRLAWVFYIFGAFLIYTALRVARPQPARRSRGRDNAVVRAARRILPITPAYDGPHLITRDGNGRRAVTPMVLVILAIGTTDLVFAVDSIPAIFGLTKVPYLIFAASAFALMGLRQLYFLLSELLHRLQYLSIGLATILGFIGVKLILEALHDNAFPLINNGKPVAWAPMVPIWLSLSVIVTTLVVTAIASLVGTRAAARSEAPA